jgi:hypothetical protein
MIVARRERRLVEHLVHRLVAEDGTVVGHRILLRIVVGGILAEDIPVDRKRRIDRIDRAVEVVGQVVPVELGVQKVVVHLV